MSLLGVRGLAKSFGGVHAVVDLDFDLEAGEILALIGPNGAGKSTCFNMLNGQLRPDAGRIMLGGRPITGLAPRRIWRLGVGRTFQITATFLSMTVLQNVQTALLSFHRRLRSLRPWADALYLDEAFALLEQVGMADQADRACSTLAYGDLKRVELAIALANAPRLLLMDEPTAGMAPAERLEVMRLASAVARERLIGVLFTEHDMDVVFAHATRVMVLDRGRLLASGSPAAVRADPRVRASYLGDEGAGDEGAGEEMTGEDGAEAAP